MPQIGKRFWRMLATDLFEAVSEDGRHFHLECLRPRTPGQDGIWLLFLATGQYVTLPARYRDEAMRLATRQLTGVRLRSLVAP